MPLMPDPLACCEERSSPVELVVVIPDIGLVEENRPQLPNELGLVFSCGIHQMRDKTACSIMSE